MAKVSDAPPTTKTIPHHFIIIVFVLLIAFSTSNCASEDYKRCSSPWTCGAMSNIGYPFWGIGRPRYCGHPALELDCGRNKSSEQPILRLSTDDQQEQYSVVAMDVSKPVISIKLQNLLGDHTCNHLVLRTTLVEFVEKQIFAYGADVDIISIFYSCQPSVTDVRNSVMCQSFTGNITGYYQGQRKHPSLVDNCESHFEVPVLKREIDRFNKGNETLLNVFKQGIEMTYDATDCNQCKDSGGICVSTSYSPFTCWKSSGSIKSWMKISAVSAVCICICVLMVIFCFRKKRIISRTIAETKCHNADAFLRVYAYLAPQRYTYANVRKMTNGFKDKLGEGGYAIVYKGKLGSGRLVAVKVLKQSRGNGDDFINEVTSISRTNHVNIVAFLGFCFEERRRALVYEFMPNGSLERFTYGGASKDFLPWETQFNIALGIAKGLDYLHRGCNARILHFDIKPHNILLDEEFRPKISDFGLARLCPSIESSISTLQARGTIGYIAPEVFCRNFGGVSHKSDVYSFGMMVLDMVCGRRNISADEQRSSQMYFPNWIYNQIETGEEDAFQGTTNDEEKALQKKMIAVSLWCIQNYPSQRPSMSRVIEMLQGCAESIEIPPRSYLSSPPLLPSGTSSETPAQTD